MSEKASKKSTSNGNSSVIIQSFEAAELIQALKQQISVNQGFESKPFSILTDRPQGINIDEQFILKLSKNSKNVTMEAKNSCKILYFSPEWSFEDVLTTIDALDLKHYPQLFIFVIVLTNFEFLKSPALESQSKTKPRNKKIKKIKKILSKFSSSRPLLLQFTSVEENVTKIRFKDKNSTDFIALEDPKSNFYDVKNFPAFLWDFLNDKFENLEEFEVKLYELMPYVHKSLLLLKFWTCLNLSDPMFSSIILEVSKTGTKTELLTALDAPYDDNIGMLRNSLENYLPYLISNDDEQLNYQSVLFTAVQHQNTEIIDYLITYWSHMIQELPFEHQVRVSTAALETNQLDVLCDLLDKADFPFPKDFKADDVGSQKLTEIVNERQRLADAIKSSNDEEIKQFIDNNQSLKIAFNLTNKSALQQAIDAHREAKNFKVYFYLKSFGFKASEFDKLEDFLTADELKAAIPLKSQQRDQKSVNLLCNRSFIHNRRISKEQEVECRRKIRHWYEDINKIKFGDLFLDVAASCDDLKIIFDFDNCSVENVSFQSSGTEGSMFSSLKWIFVGAKLTDSDNKQRHQKIKGVLAHELCHYVMMLVYENQEHPYYKIIVKIAEMFEEIVKAINKWSSEDLEDPDDECNRIISSVFRLYDRKDFHPELIVRAAQILVEFDDDQVKSQHLQDKYKILFDFWEYQVIPDLRAFNLKVRESVRKMNRLLELLDYIKDELYNFIEPKDIKVLFDNQLTIVTSNVPMLLLNDIYNHLQDTIGDLFETQNIFLDPEVLKNEEILRDFKKSLQENPKLNVIVDCSSELPENVKDFQKVKTIFVVSNQEQLKKLREALNDPKELEINYNWSDLTQESQEQLIDHEVRFQGSHKLSLLQLLMPDNVAQEPKSSESFKKAKCQVLRDFSEIVDDKFLNLLLDGSKISINLEVKEDGRPDDYRLIDREFIKKTQKEIKLESIIQTIKFGLVVNREGQIAFVPNITEDQLLFDVEDKPVVLISDIAGSGKSWIMKNFAEIFRNDDFIKWVTFVDLKQFIDVFKAHDGEPNFAAFMAEKILKPRQQFEAKIFQKLYKIGKVLIFFDGFDEIAPDCAEFVSKMAQNFEQNGGNQLWIATRDFFEIDLQKMLNTDAIYKIRELDAGEVTTFIAQSWLLMENDMKFKSKADFLTYVRNPEGKYQKFLRKAHKIVDKHFSKWLSPIGMPHLLTMIAECYKNDKDGIGLNLSIIFEKFMDREYERWCSEKGQIRKTANTKSQKFGMNFFKMHQYFAIAVLFPEFLTVLFSGCDVSNWTAEELVACGLMSKYGNNIFFVHQTYGEYFVADLVTNGLMESEIDEKIFKLFVKILSSQKCVIIRSFINGLIKDSTMDKIQSKIEEIAENFDKNSNFTFESFVAEVFMENLDKFIKIIIKFISSTTYNKRKEILFKCTPSIAANSRHTKSFNAFKTLIFDCLNDVDLKDWILNCGFLSGIIRSSLKFTEFESFIKEVAAKIDKVTVRNLLMSSGSFGFGDGNIFHHFSQSPRFDPPTLKKILQICQDYSLGFNEIRGLVRHCNEHNHSILNLCVMSPSYVAFKEFWREIVALYLTYCSSEYLKEFFKQEDLNGFTVLDYLINHPDVQLHEDFWDILLTVFDDREELKDLILKNDKKNNANFFHKLMINPNPAVIEFVADVMHKKFTNVQYTKIIKSKGPKDANLLLIAVNSSKLWETQQLVWKLVQQTCRSDDEFRKMLMAVDTDGKDILQYCMRISTNEIFKFFIEELEKLTTRDEMSRMLSHKNNYGFLMLQYCALQNPHLDLHESVWKVMRKYFKNSEIFNFIHQVDTEFGENLLFFPLIRNNLEILKFTWNEIKKILSHDEQISYLMMKNKQGKNLLERTSVQISNEIIGNDKIEWVKNLFREYKIEV